MTSATSTNKWTAEGVYYYYVSEKEKFANVVPRHIKLELANKMHQLQKRAPHIYCNVPEAKFNMRYNKKGDWMVRHCGVLAKLLNQHGFPTWVMGELTQPCPKCQETTINVLSCPICWGLGRVP